jgi:hypothetical protein
MIRATNQSGVFYMGSRPFRPMASAEYGAMPLAFGLYPKNASEHSQPSNRALQYTRQNFAYTTDLADRRRFIAAINELGNMLKEPTHIQAHLVFADTQSPNKKPKELEFCQSSIKI